MGIRWANKLRTNYTYYFTVKVNAPTEPSATLFLDRQLGGGPTTWQESLFCDTYFTIIGRGAACTFAWASEGEARRSFTLLEDEVVYEPWSD